MLRKLINTKGQATSSEYVITFFLIVSMVTAMTVYFRRSVQARVHDTRVYMFNQTVQLARETNAAFYANLYMEYEPYYGNTQSDVIRRSDEDTELLPGGTTGIYRKSINEVTQIHTNSVTAPPKAAK